MTVAIATADNPTDYEVSDAFVPDLFKWEQFDTRANCEKRLSSWFVSDDNDSLRQMHKRFDDEYPERIEPIQTSEDLLDIGLDQPEHNKMFCVEVQG